MKLALVALAALALSACCVFGGQMDNLGIDLGVSARWDGGLPPPGSSATVDFYVMAEGSGSWNLLELDVPFPEELGALVDTFWYQYEVPQNGDKVTYRYEVDLTVAGEVYSFSCESGEWWWFAGGQIMCQERAR